MSDQRYEPLPSLEQLPAWLWRRIGRGTRIALGVSVLVVIALTVVFVPAMRQDQRERAAREAHAIAVRHTQAIRELQREQRPRYGRSMAPARPAMLADLERAILADARARGGAGEPTLRARCEPFPKTVGGVPPEADPRKPGASYACLAVTAQIDRSAASAGGELGDPYRASLDFRTGRFALCKVAGRPDPVPDPEVATPRACSGGRLPAP